MEATIHSTAVNVEVYPDEFKPLLKLINLALINDEVMKRLDSTEAHVIYSWLDEFQSKALEYGV